ncbi:hypothetical protein SPLC1_S201140 [Arthrospira platensis C1]|nr:hypothetical protein SPLC1_S201140 [Arthrospira platensis C1]
MIRTEFVGWVMRSHNPKTHQIAQLGVYKTDASIYY